MNEDKRNEVLTTANIIFFIAGICMFLVGYVWYSWEIAISGAMLVAGGSFGIINVRLNRIERRFR